MRKIFFYVFVPIILLTGFYFVTKKSGLNLQGNFNRKFASKNTLKIIKSFTVSGIVDGITVDKQSLWINQRFSIIKYDPDTANQLHLKGKYGSNNHPIVNLWVENDSVFYYQGNTPTINMVDLTQNSALRLYKLSFPISYFIKSKNNAFLFQENVPVKVCSQIHYQDFSNGANQVNSNVFSRDEGSGIRYSGTFLSSNDKKYMLFVCFYDDYIFCMDAYGNLRYKIKAIDYQKQNLDIIREGQVYYLSPKASILRLSACVYKNKLLIVSKAKAVNQSDNDFKNNSTIDVYNIEDGKYDYSFYIPKFYGYDPSNMTVSEAGTMYTSYGATILTFHLDI